MKKRVQKVITAAIIIIAAGLLYYVLNRYTGFAIPCYIRKLTGLYCPGCGITGMLIDLIHLDFFGAFTHNQMLFISLPFIIYIIVKVSVGYIVHGTTKLKKADNIMVYVMIALFLIFFVIRNIPMCTCLRPYWLQCWK